MHLRSAEIEISGSDRPAIRVTCELKREGSRRDISIRFHGAGNSGDLSIHGGPSSNVLIRVEVPRFSNLYVRSPAGEMRVLGVTGDKDVELYAGDLTIEAGNAGDYRHADASVTSGDITASAFSVTKAGLFRSFRVDQAAGKYTLHAHLMAGEFKIQ